MVRGGLLDRPDLLREDAEDNRALYGFFGISVWAVLSEFPLDWVLSTKLRSARFVAQIATADIGAAGLTLLATGQAPHFDVTHERLDVLVSALADMARVVRQNEFYDVEGSG